MRKPLQPTSGKYTRRALFRKWRLQGRGNSKRPDVRVTALEHRLRLGQKCRLNSASLTDIQTTGRPAGKIAFINTDGTYDVFLDSGIVVKEVPAALIIQGSAGPSASCTVGPFTPLLLDDTTNALHGFPVAVKRNPCVYIYGSIVERRWWAQRRAPASPGRLKIEWIK